MLSFTSSLSPDSEAIVIFVTDKYDCKDKRHILSKSTSQKIDSFLSTLKTKKKAEDINHFDISNKQRCFVVKVKNKDKNYSPQESGGSFFSYLKKFNDITKIDLYPDSLDIDKEKFAGFFSQFIFGFELKSYTFNKKRFINRT